MIIDDIASCIYMLVYRYILAYLFMFVFYLHNIHKYRSIQMRLCGACTRTDVVRFDDPHMEAQQEYRTKMGRWRREAQLLAYEDMFAFLGRFVYETGDGGHMFLCLLKQQSQLFKSNDTRWRQ